MALDVTIASSLSLTSTLTSDCKNRSVTAAFAFKLVLKIHTVVRSPEKALPPCHVSHIFAFNVNKFFPHHTFVV